MSEDKKTDGSEGTVTQEQFDELKATINSMNDVLKAKEESIDALTENNKKLANEKREQESSKEKARQEKLAADGDHKTLLQEREAHFDEERKTMIGDMNRMNAQLNGITGDAALTASLKSVGVNEDMLSVVESHFRSTWSFDDKGSVQHNGMPLADSVKSWASEVGKPFLSSNNSGSGAKPSTSNQSTPTHVGEMTEDQLIEAAENGTLPDSGSTWV